MVEVRRCRAEDFADVRALLAQLWPGEPPDENGLREVYGRGPASDAHVYLCAVEAERVVGFGSLTIKNSLWQRGSLGHVDELVVDGGHRGRGVGTRLLNELVGAAAGVPPGGTRLGAPPGSGARVLRA